MIGVGVGVSVMIGVGVGVGVSVMIGVGVGVSVMIGVGVGVSVMIGVGVGVSVMIGVGVGVGVSVMIGVGVGVGVSVMIGVGVGRSGSGRRGRVRRRESVGVGAGVSAGVGHWFRIEAKDAPFADACRARRHIADPQAKVAPRAPDGVTRENAVVPELVGEKRPLAGVATAVDAKAHVDARPRHVRGPHHMRRAEVQGHQLWEGRAGGLPRGRDLAVVDVGCGMIGSGRRGGQLAAQRAWGARARERAARQGT